MCHLHATRREGPKMQGLLSAFSKVSGKSGSNAAAIIVHRLRIGPPRRVLPVSGTKLRSFELWLRVFPDDEPSATTITIREIRPTPLQGD